jgi:hypothetical protein
LCLSADGGLVSIYASAELGSLGGFSAGLAMRE